MDRFRRYNLADLEYYFVETTVTTPTTSGATGTERTRSGLALGLDARRFVEEGAPLLGDAVEPHLKNKTQRQRLIEAVVGYYGTGYDVEVIKALMWQGITKSPTGDPAHPWTREEVEAIVEDVVSRPAPDPKPLEEWPTVLLNGKPIRSNGHGAPAAAAARPLDEVPPFPLETLPAAFRALVEEGAAALPCPPDFVATPLLVAAGAAIGDALELQLKPGWREGPNLYAAVIGDPGSKKTPAQELALRPLHRIQGRYDRVYQEELAAHEREAAAWEDGKKGQRGAKPTPPTYAHVLTTDATTEALAPMLLASKGLILIKDELVAWIRSMDQYRSGGKGADRQHYLSMWSRSPIKVDRKSSPNRAPIYVPRPVLAVVGGIQPDLLGDLADAAGREDGFVDRLLLSYPDPVPDRWTTARIAQRTETAVLKIFEALQGLRPVGGAHGEPVPWTVRLSAAAADLWSDWYADQAAEKDAEGFPAQLRGPWAKMPGQLARLALILHAVAACAADEDVHDTLEAGALAAAADLIDYYKAHARRAYRRMARGRRDLAVTMLVALKERGPLSQSAIYDGVLHCNVPAGKVRDALDGLEDAGLVHRRPQQGANGRPATIWAAS